MIIPQPAETTAGRSVVVEAKVPASQGRSVVSFRSAGGVVSKTEGSGAVPTLDERDVDGVRWLTLRRPGKRNALDAATGSALTDAIRRADGDGVGCVVLTGSEGSFSAGVDLGYLADMARGEASGEPMLELLDTVTHAPMPVIAAVNGVAVGVGTTICLHVDLVVAARSARFRTPFTQMGVAPEAGSSWLLPQQVGVQMASWMLLSSAWVDAHEAAERGLVFEVVDDHRLADSVQERAALIAAQDPAAVRAAKRTVRAWRAGPVADAMATENAEFGVLLRRER